MCQEILHTGKALPSPTISLPTPQEKIKLWNTDRWPILVQMLRAVTTLFGCRIRKCFSRALIFPYRSGIIPALARSCKLQKSVVISLSTKGRGMPKKDKASIPRSDQQRAESQTQEGNEGILSVISATKNGQICVKILAKPGAKQSNITGEGCFGTRVLFQTN